MSIASSQAPLVCVEEYRKLLKDKRSTPEQIQKRVQYVETFCRAIIRRQLESYAKEQGR